MYWSRRTIFRKKNVAMYLCQPKVKVEWEDLKRMKHSEVPGHVYLELWDDHLDHELLAFI